MNKENSPTAKSAPKAGDQAAADKAPHNIPRGLETDEELMAVYKQFLAEDPDVEEFAIEAYHEMKSLPYDHLDKAPRRGVEPAGVVGRRAPLNPLASPKLGKYRIGETKAPKIEDPALEANPLRGRLIVCLSTSFILIFVFFQSLVVNYINTGKALVPYSENSMLGPSGDTLNNLGGLNTNSIREGQLVRLFWSMWMHSGFFHIALNVLSQLQFFYMFEPDWGFWRCLILFWISGISGNLLSAVMDPCTVTVGSSGGLYGLMGAMIVYCIEYWKSIPRPLCILIFTLIIVILSFLLGFSGSTDNWAHLGGLLGGLLFAFGTITTLSACQSCVRKDDKDVQLAIERQKTAVFVAADGKKKKKKVINKPAQALKKEIPGCRMGKLEWSTRICSWALLIALWVMTWVMLLVNYDFHPPGKYTFSGAAKCCCCYVAQPHVRANWHCRMCLFPPPSEAITDGDEDFETFCANEGSLRTPDP